MTLGNLQFYQVAVLVISIVMAAPGVWRFICREPNQTWLKLFVRLAVWGGMSAVALFPQFTNYLAKFIGLEGNINAVILTGFLLVFSIIFKILTVVERIEQNISVLARRDALRQLPKKNDPLA